MKIIPIQERDSTAWDRFAEQSPDAWFWQTTHWMQYTQEYAGKAFRQNLSFWIMKGGAPMAIVPCFLEVGPAVMSLYHGDVQGSDLPRLSFAGAPLPAPALDAAVNTQTRWNVLELAVARLKEIAEANGVENFELMVPSLAHGYLASSPPKASPFQRFGALDISRATQIIDLRSDVSELWTAVRHGHQYDIRRGERELTVKVWHGSDLPPSVFEEYRSIHAKDAGRVTRSAATFLMMRDWILEGNGALAQVMKGSTSIGFALLILFGKGAYYGSGCRDPDHMKLPAYHVAQWQLIRWLKEQDFEFYDVGIQQFSRQWFDNPNAKHISISKFKRGFGGTTVPLYVGEFHLNEAGLRRSIEDRLRYNYSTS